MHRIDLLLALALTVASPQADRVVLSPDLKALIAQRDKLGDEVFVEKVRVLAARDDDSAVELLGELYTFGGFGLVSDPVKGCAQFGKIASRRGDAAHNLARCYEDGRGLPTDLAKARIWYARGADFGYTKSSCALGNMLIEGRGGLKDVAKGIGLCRSAADRGDPDAQTDLANYFLYGKIVAQDVVLARKWYTLAAEQNQANAQLVLGQIFWNGDGTPVDRAAAVSWWKKAWDGGRKDAAGLIVRSLYDRMISTRDGKQAVDRSLLPETILWLERAAAEEPDPAKRKAFAEALATQKAP